MSVRHRHLIAFIALLISIVRCSAQSKVYDGGSRFVHGFARIQGNNSYFYIDSLGNYAFDRILNGGTVLPVANEDGSLNGVDSIEGQLPTYFLLVSKKGKLGILSLRNKWILQPLYDSIDTRYSPEWVVTKENKKSLFTSKGFLMPFKYEDIFDMDGRHFNVKQNGKWGVYSRQEDKMIIPFAYEDLDYCYGCEAKGDYVFAQKNEKWGVVDFKNKVLVPFLYDHMHMNMRSDQWVQCLYKDGHQMIINLNTGKVDTCGCDGDDETSDDKEDMADGFVRQRKNDQWGMLDAKGKLILDYKYDFIRYDHDTLGDNLPAPFVALNYHNKHGIADTTGKILIQPIYEDWFSCLNNAYFVSGINGQQSLFDLNGHRVLEGTYDDIEKWKTVKTGDDSVDLLKLTKGKQYGFYNTKTKQVIEPQYSYLYSFNEADQKGWIEVEKKGKKGFIDVNGHTIVPVVYDYIQQMANEQENFMAVRQGLQYGIYDVREKKLLVPMIYDVISSMQHTGIWQIEKQGRSGLLDPAGLLLCQPDYDVINQLDSTWYLLTKVDTTNEKSTYSLLNGQTKKMEVLPFDSVSNLSKGTVLAVEDSGKAKLFDVTTNKIIQGDYSLGGFPDLIGPFENKRAVFRKNNKTGYLDPKGHILIAPQHTLLTERFFNGLALVADAVDSSMQAFHYGYMDSTGKVIVPIIYDVPATYTTNYTITDYFADGYLLLLKKDPKDDYHFLKGYATQKGTVFIPPNYDKITPLNKHLFYLVQKDKKLGILDSLGAQVLPVDFDDLQVNNDNTWAGPQTLSFPLLGYKDKSWHYYTKDGKKRSLEISNIIDYTPPYDEQSTGYYSYSGNYGAPDKQMNVPDKNATHKSVLDGKTDNSDALKIEDPSITNSSKAKDASIDGVDSSTLRVVTEASQEALKAANEAYHEAVDETTDPTITISPPVISQESRANADLLDDDSTIIFTTVEHAPTYPGGTKAMRDFIQQHTKIPKEARDAKVSGKVLVRFEVTKKGAIQNATASFDAVGHHCAGEAVRVISSMPKWNPGIQNNRAVNVWVTVPVVFKTK